MSLTERTENSYGSCRTKDEVFDYTVLTKRLLGRAKMMLLGADLIGRHYPQPVFSFIQNRNTDTDHGGSDD
ncbi:MAG: hypothetical protein C4K49_06640 [Candidatus Thorarchaeota archaeon]|nr:MAG: hypothetical protein C4K49_06640 [Candidatus Thorarchaeota archaeon]